MHLNLDYGILVGLWGLLLDQRNRWGFYTCLDFRADPGRINLHVLMLDGLV